MYISFIGSLVLFFSKEPDKEGREGRRRREGGRRDKGKEKINLISDSEAILSSLMF